MQAFKRPRQWVLADVPWTFGSVSIMSLFWNESGKLDEKLGDFEGVLPSYLRVTRGHGCGADSAVRAEVMLMRGEDELAEILSHRALYEARSKNQISICICAELILAQIAILRGDKEGYVTAIDNLSGYTKEDSNQYISSMADLCLSFISIQLGITGMIAKWFKDMETIQRKIYAPAVPFAQVIYSYLLLVGKRYNELYGISQSMLEGARNMGSLLLQIYHHIILAWAGYETGNKGSASEHFARALNLAMPDRIFFPFSLLQDNLEPLVSLQKKPLFENDAKSLEDLLVLCNRQFSGLKEIRKCCRRITHTGEKEVALLAKKRS